MLLGENLFQGNRREENWRHSSVVESLPSMSETLNSPIAAKKQNKKASKQETQQKFYFNNVLTSFYQPDRIKLKSLGKKDLQLRSCLHWTGLWVYL